MSGSDLYYNIFEHTGKKKGKNTLLSAALQSDIAE